MSDENTHSSLIAHRSALFAGVCFTFMPVVLNMAHEAKPHLPGAVLVLLTCIVAMKYLETSRRRWLWMTGALCGASVGMVLSAWVAFAVLIAIAIVRRKFKAILAAAALGVFVYFITNPYVAINLVANPAVIQSNIANSAAFYHVGWDALANAAMLVRVGTSSLLAIAGLIAAVVLIKSRQASLSLIAAPAIATALMFFAFASHQPQDYARFALTLDIALMIAAMVGIARIKSPAPRIALLAVLALSTVLSGSGVLLGFFRDRGPETSRLAAAIQIDGYKTFARRLVIFDEPAPYCLPPADLWHWQIVLMPRGATLEESHYQGDLIVAVDHNINGIGWADKRFFIIDAAALDKQPVILNTASHN